MEEQPRPKVVVPRHVDRPDSIHRTLRPKVPTSEAETPIARELRRSMEMRQTLNNAEVPQLHQNHIVAVANQKGGVGKTTSLVNIAMALAQRGTEVLVVDSDPQGNASTALGIDHHAGTPSLYDVYTGEASLAEVAQPCPEESRLLVVPSTVDLAGIEMELADEDDRNFYLRNAIAAYLRDREGCLVLVDCPPSLGLLTVNAFCAARWVLIPVQAEYYALEGISLLTDTMGKIRDSLNPDLQLLAFLITMFDRRTNLASQVEADVRVHYPDLTLQTNIPRQVAVSEAPSWRQTVITYEKNSPGSLAYQMAALEILNRLADKG